MAAKETAGFKSAENHSLMSNEEKWVKASYSFALDAGATTDTYELMDLPVGYVITDAYAHVTTAFVGATSTYEIGYTGDTDAVIAQTAVASMTLGAILPLAGKRLIASGANTLYMTIGTAAATAGALDLYVKVKRNA